MKADFIAAVMTALSVIGLDTVGAQIARIEPDWTLTCPDEDQSTWCLYKALKSTDYEFY